MQDPRAAPVLRELALEGIEAALIESVAREERDVLNPVEQARAFATLKEERGLTFQQLGDLVGCHKAKVANVMRLLKLPEEILELVADGELTEAHGRSLLIAKDPEIRRELGYMAVEEGWSTQELTERAHESNIDATESGHGPQAQGSDSTRGQVSALNVATAWGEVLGKVLGGVEVEVRPMRHGRMRIEVPFTSAQAALYAAGRLGDAVARGSIGGSGSEARP
jgi:ParB-like chromosome segregation protein Spo0J